MTTWWPLHPSLDASVLWTERLVAVALLLQSLELLQVRAACADDGVWRWSILSPEHRALPFPLRWLFGALLPYRAFVAMLFLRLPLCALLFSGHGFAAPLLFLSQLAVCVRFRGTFNGGSDYMTVVLLVALSGASVLGRSQGVLKACLAYVCVQLVLSYWIAGMVKLRRPSWRSGDALRAFLAANRHGTPAWVSRAVSTPLLARALAWVVLTFECLFPLALLEPRLALGWLGAGLAFHVANALVFGLNRFVFAWVSAYPALLYFSSRIAAP